jgi:hypothetical protein
MVYCENEEKLNVLFHRTGNENLRIYSEEDYLLRLRSFGSFLEKLQAKNVFRCCSGKNSNLHSIDDEKVFCQLKALPHTTLHGILSSTNNNTEAPCLQDISFLYARCLFVFKEETICTRR